MRSAITALAGPDAECLGPDGPNVPRAPVSAKQSAEGDPVEQAPMELLGPDNAWITLAEPRPSYRRL
jgi:hypothetical protein